MRHEKEKNFIIKEIFPLTRKDSKYYHLIIVTKNGLRVYISFSVEYTNEEILNEKKILEKNKNLIYRYRPTKEYSIVLKPLPEPTNSTIFEHSSNERAFRLLTERTNKQIFFVDHKFIIFYKDEFKKKSFLDVVEFEDNSYIKSDLSNSTIAEITQVRNTENVINILNLDFSREVHGFFKNKNIEGYSENFLDFSSLLKRPDEDNEIILSPGVNFLDAENCVSLENMHRFSKQIFEIPEQYILFTSSGLIYVSKRRPIDELFKIILDNQEFNNPKSIFSNDFLIFLNKFGISETAYMLLVIFTNYNMKFNYFEENNFMNFNTESSNPVNSSVDRENVSPNAGSNLLMRTVKNNDSYMKIAFDLYVKLLDYLAVSNNPESEGFERFEKGSKFF